MDQVLEVRANKFAPGRCPALGPSGPEDRVVLRLLFRVAPGQVGEVNQQLGWFVPGVDQLEDRPETGAATPTRILGDLVGGQVFLNLLHGRIAVNVQQGFGLQFVQDPLLLRPEDDRVSHSLRRSACRA